VKHAGIPRKRIENDIAHHKKVRKYNTKRRDKEKPELAEKLCSVAEREKYGKTKYASKRSKHHEREKCVHDFSEEDKVMLYMKGYEKFTNY
jgi:hypothetical protein